MEKNLSDQTEFLAKKEEVETWLQKAHGTIQDCAGDGSKEVLKERLDTVNMVAERMSEGELSNEDNLEEMFQIRVSKILKNEIKIDLLV